MKPARQLLALFCCAFLTAAFACGCSADAPRHRNFDLLLPAAKVAALKKRAFAGDGPAAYELYMHYSVGFVTSAKAPSGFDLHTARVSRVHESSCAGCARISWKSTPNLHARIHCRRDERSNHAMERTPKAFGVAHLVIPSCHSLTLRACSLCRGLPVHSIDELARLVQPSA
jgi:hypothetical protein